MGKIIMQDKRLIITEYQDDNMNRYFMFKKSGTNGDGICLSHEELSGLQWWMKNNEDLILRG